MPVVVPLTASTDTVKAVLMRSVLRCTMSGSRSCSRRSPSMGTTTSPRAWVTMKLMASGVAISAAMATSPSFSRSSSSTMMTMPPDFIRSIAASTDICGINVSCSAATVACPGS